MRQLWVWLTSVCLFASVPFLLLLLLRAPYMPTFERITGLGQLLPTAFTLLGGGVRELGTVSGDRRKGMRNFTYRMSYVFGAASLAVWFSIQHDLVSRGGSLPYDVQHRNAWQSVVLLCMCAVIAAIGVLVATPAKEAGTR
jgi:hypothetical protein